MVTKSKQPTKDQTEAQTIIPAKHLISNIKIIPKTIANPAEAKIITQVLATSFIEAVAEAIASTPPILIVGDKLEFTRHILPS